MGGGVQYISALLKKIQTSPFPSLNGDVSINKNLVFKKYKMTNKESKDNLIEIHGLWCKDIVNVFGYSFCKKAASSGI